MGHWVGHNKYIEILRILVHLIFIYLILQINKDTLFDLQKNSGFSCTVCTDSRGRQNQTYITRFCSAINYCLELSVLLFSPQRNLYQKKTLVTCTTKLRVDFFMNCS